MKAITHTEAGGKLENEDYVIARRHPGGGERYVCVMADGQGGRSHGALAARTACKGAWSGAMQQPFDTLLKPSAWSIFLHAADQEVCCTEGFTTLMALVVDATSVVGASCGDSKVFYSNGSTDAEIEEWTSRQRKNPPVGSGEAMFEPFGRTGIEGGRILMLSDGVWKYCGYEAIREAMKIADLAAVPALLRAATLKRSGSALPDDFSVIAVEVG